MLKWKSVPGSIIFLCMEGIIKPLLNEKILKEYKEVLSRKKFNFNQDSVDQVISSIISEGIMIDAKEIDIDMPDKKDKIFYEVAIEKAKEEYCYLITGNIKHFPQEQFVVTPRQMLEIISEE